ncbi:LamB/YcsF family protein [Puniceicoccaceae bacterium K14]|nr:LamB/YcsF family protein [Puniceicoccaceae bacterium K14]
MGRLAINCDLGEGESFEVTERLMRLIDAANISCGVHAGSAKSTKDCIALAKRLGVAVGAHPGLPGHGGRGSVDISASEFGDLLGEQLRSFKNYCAEEGAAWNHVKLHGSLYSKVEKDDSFAETYLQVLKEVAPGVSIFALANGRFSGENEVGTPSVCGEIFADRSYQDDGSLTRRADEGTVLTCEDEIVSRLKAYIANGEMKTVSGRSINLQASTLCVHSDTGNALEILQAIRSLLV